MIVDIQATTEDIHCVVDIVQYSHFLIESLPDWPEVAIDFGNIQEIRGTFWENPIPSGTPDELAERECKRLAKKYNLEYVTD